MTTPLPSSTWISSMAYKRTPDGSTWLVFFLRPYKNVGGVKQEPRAIIYGGPGSELPSWLPGLIKSGRAKTAKGNIDSPGAVYHRMVKEKYPHQTVKGQKMVNQLREMMK
jgi:hypothetical protein